MAAGKKNKSAFTLIEIVIVMAAIAVLSVALISALEPGEQIQRARDRVFLNHVVEFYKANQRYYSINLSHPATYRTRYASGIPPTPDPLIPTPTPTPLPAAEPVDVALDRFLQTGEISQSYRESMRQYVPRIGVSIIDPSGRLAICAHQFESGHYRTDPAAIYDINGDILPGCPAASNPACSICFR